MVATSSARCTLSCTTSHRGRTRRDTLGERVGGDGGMGEGGDGGMEGGLFRLAGWGASMSVKVDWEWGRECVSRVLDSDPYMWNGKIFQDRFGKICIQY